MAIEVTIKRMLEAGVHFGHQKRRWNPKMARYIFGERNGIYIIDLQKTANCLKNAIEFVRNLSSKGGTILFVGTKKQAQKPIEEGAARANMPYVSQRWLGGTLTNFTTVRRSLLRFRALKKSKEDGSMARLPRLEMLAKQKELDRMQKNLGGIEHLNKIPDALFVIDPHKERTAISEATRLQIPVVAMLDTNSDPDEITYPIPSNDDAIRAITLMSSVIAESAHEGRLLADTQEDALDEENDGVTADEEEMAERSKRLAELEARETAEAAPEAAAK